MEKKEKEIEENKEGVIKEEESEAKVSYIFELIKIIIWSLIIIIPIRTFLFQPFFVKGISMETNFYDGDYLIVNELGFKETDVSIAGKDLFTVENFREFKRGAVVVFHYPNNPKDFFIKRIIGLPGEKISIKSDRVMIFNEEYPEGFVLDESKYLLGNSQLTNCDGKCVYELGEEEYFVLGDNRNHSSDSRSWGKLGQSFVVGKVFLRAWPIENIKVF
ncbi:MAG: signal peptidase I [Patescibacteria group bacterium]|nr:signal peptidase I [Patescibacteria group bacterium]